MRKHLVRNGLAVRISPTEMNIFCSPGTGSIFTRRPGPELADRAGIRVAYLQLGDRSGRRALPGPPPPPPPTLSAGEAARKRGFDRSIRNLGRIPKNSGGWSGKRPVNAGNFLWRSRLQTLRPFERREAVNFDDAKNTQPRPKTGYVPASTVEWSSNLW